MTTSTLPRVAMRLLGDIAYPMRSLVDGAPLAVFVPQLLDDTYRWAEDDEVLPEHVTLDLTTVAELFFDSPLDPADGPTDALLRDTIVEQLTSWHCDLKPYLGRVFEELAAHPEVALPRMCWCLELAARIVRTEAAQ